MDQTSFQYYRCPADLQSLRLENAVQSNGAIESGDLVSPAGRRYGIEGGIPNLVFPHEPSATDTRTRDQYDQIAGGIYDAAVDWQFAALHEDENRVREAIIDLLAIEPDHRVLEVGCGTGRDSFRLARRLGADGALFLQDLSPNMVAACRARIVERHREMPTRCAIDYSISNAMHLPFPSDLFDAVFHAGGFNRFSEPERAVAEFVRVVKPGGIVLYGDESVAPWLRGTEFERILCANNPLFAHDVPLRGIPACAREVTVRWMVANCFYVITFRKGEGLPPLDLDLPHQGWRGGTMRSRYFGVLEGVSPEAKRMAEEAAARQGVSVHAWLDQVVRKRATEDLAGIGPDHEQ
jgi:ubiquinone/menaquinone biosynthesis C-methylase UbiE/uncharacterized protein YbaR (Trm112 family)